MRKQKFSFEKGNKEEMESQLSSEKPENKKQFAKELIEYTCQLKLEKVYLLNILEELIEKISNPNYVGMYLNNMLSSNYKQLIEPLSDSKLKKLFGLSDKLVKQKLEKKLVKNQCCQMNTQIE